MSMALVSLASCQLDDTESEARMHKLDSPAQREKIQSAKIIAPATYHYRVVNTFPHDQQAFTQGLVYLDNDQLLESTGLRGQSSLRRVDLATGKVIKKISLANTLFAEGITVLNNKIYQLTWQAHKGFVYDLETFTRLKEFSYSTEGWGMTNDGQHLIVSDGTSNLYFWDPLTLTEKRRIVVSDQNGLQIKQLNELEYIHGQIYANIWKSNQIVRIDPNSGLVVGWIDLNGLLTPNEYNKANVLNGIAYDKVNDRLFVTGKKWPKIFQIILISKEN